ncbi:MAG: hypothetical protein CMJ83_17540 [Planctomycetes bacterium]|nr:hypothetical protein [Planctomycetota bacterium]
MKPIATTLVLLALSGLASAQLQFTDVTQTAGISWIHFDPGNYQMGAACAFLDYDQDGWLDVLLAGAQGSCGLFRNQANGTFVDITLAAGLFLNPGGDYTMGAHVADYDNDGYPDIYFTRQGPNLLYRNNGNGTFTDVTTQAGVGHGLWGTAAAFGDYDGDGDLDLYLGNDHNSGIPPNVTAQPNVLYRNEGNGTFTDVTAQTGVDGLGATLAVTWTDYDGDGDVDIMVGHDFGAEIQPNQLYRNDGPDLNGAPGDWTFTDVSAAMGANIAIYCMGIAVADFDRDLDLDYYFTNHGQNVLLRNFVPGIFQDVTQIAGVQNASYGFGGNAVGWGCGFFDFDNDGWEDLYVSNGFISSNYIPSPPQIPNALFHHNGPALNFTDVAYYAGVDDGSIGRGVAFGDYDRDGDIDILQGNVGTPILFRNDSPAQGNFFRIAPRGRVGTRDGYHTRVQVLAGGVTQFREVNPNTSFESSNENVAHFGVGPATFVERVSLQWPSGVTHQVHDLPVGLTIPAVEPVVTVDATSSAPPTIAEGNTLSLDLVIRNETGVARTAFNLLTVEAAGASFVLPFPAASVPAAGTRVVNLSVPIPLGFLGGGSSLPIRGTWTVYDAGAAVDQWRFDLLITP